MGVHIADGMSLSPSYASLNPTPYLFNLFSFLIEGTATIICSMNSLIICAFYVGYFIIYNFLVAVL